MCEIIFGTGSVPINIAAKVYGKDACWVRAGIISGWLPIGIATKNLEVCNDINDRNGRTNFYISPKLLYEHTGFIYKGGNNVSIKE